jgi:hypothetical protein
VTRPLRRPPIVLAAGQVWRAADGTERAIVTLHPPTGPAGASLQVRWPNGRTGGMEPNSLIQWIR